MLIQHNYFIIWLLQQKIGNSNRHIKINILNLICNKPITRKIMKNKIKNLRWLEASKNVWLQELQVLGAVICANILSQKNLISKYMERTDLLDI